ncbi:MAG: type II toxin-antitoxin system RelB/DinJ family antitoxin [Planctomycetota bacterium]|jgi:DNA-damage-inducible protein J
MANGTTIQARIDPNTKERARGILNTLGISISEAISMYMRQIVLHRGIPFDVKIPNELTAKTLRDSEAGKGLHRVANTEELFKELDI